MCTTHRERSKLKRVLSQKTNGVNTDQIHDSIRQLQIQRDGRELLHDCQQHRQHALQPAWADGHGTGLYTFPYLQRLAAGSPSSQTP